MANSILKFLSFCVLLGGVICISSCSSSEDKTVQLTVNVNPIDCAYLRYSEGDASTSVYFDPNNPNPTYFQKTISRQINKGMHRIEAIPISDNIIFDNWSGSINSSDNPFILEANSSINLVANFLTFGRIYVDINGLGTTKIEKELDKTTKILNVVITAIPPSSGEYEFSGWTGDYESNENPIKLTLNSNNTKNIFVTANFIKLPKESNPPKILLFTFEPQEVDVKDSAKTITFSAHATDESGISEYYPIVSVYIPEHKNSTEIKTAFKLISGNTKDGTYSASVTIPKGSLQGEWTILTSGWEDVFFNHSDNITPTSDKKTLTVK